MVFAQDGDDSIWQPEPGTSWPWQLSGEINPSWEVAMYDIDLFDSPQATIDRLHADGPADLMRRDFAAGRIESFITVPDSDNLNYQVLMRQPGFLCVRAGK